MLELPVNMPPTINLDSRYPVATLVGGKNQNGDKSLDEPALDCQEPHHFM